MAPRTAKHPARLRALRILFACAGLAAFSPLAASPILPEWTRVTSTRLEGTWTGMALPAALPGADVAAPLRPRALDEVRSHAEPAEAVRSLKCPLLLLGA